MNSNTTYSVLSFLDNINPIKILDSKPEDTIYHIGIYGINDNIYMTVTLTNNAIMYNGKWYSYSYDSTQTKSITEMYNEAKIVK